jgi:hypothetical protein
MQVHAAREPEGRIVTLIDLELDLTVGLYPHCPETHLVGALAGCAADRARRIAFIGVADDRTGCGRIRCQTGLGYDRYDPEKAANKNK